MQLHHLLCSALLASVLVTSRARAQGAMGDAQYIKVAESGAPAAISSKAAITRLDAKGNATIVRTGTNGFTCIVGVPGDPDAAFCADQNGYAWMVSAASGLPKPTSTQPGIAYMAQGGLHYETPSGEVVMMPDANTHSVKEPPHWMLMWPFDPAASGLPTKPNPGGVYIMFAGTPYAHLMIYQNPNAIK
jgi:hypothetical protein